MPHAVRLSTLSARIGPRYGRAAGFACFAAFAWLTACSGSDDAPAAAPPADVEAPVISAPVAGATIPDPVTVEGTATAGTRVTVTLLQNDAEVGSGWATVDASGQWQVAVGHDNAPGDLTISAVTVVGARRSSPTTVVVDVAGQVQTAAVVIRAPVANTVVFDFVDVQGTAEPNANLDAVIKRGVPATTQILGQATATADGGGQFALRVSYTNASPDEPLTLEVADTDRGSVASVALAHGRATAMSGRVVDPTGYPGDQLIVRAYHPDADGLDYVAETRLTVASDQPFDIPFDINVPAGQFVFRAFRDAGGMMYPAPDGEPSLGIDAQSGPTPVTVGDTAPAVTLTLSAPVLATSVPNFAVFTRHESAQTYPPTVYDGGEPTEGQGECGGFYMKIEASNIANPRVRLPSGTIVELLDDGGCRDGLDNRNRSYDDLGNDGNFSLGIADPGDDETGAYALAFFEGDQVGVLVDEISTIRRLDRRVRLVSPTGGEAVTTTRPTLEWNAVDGAYAYALHIWSPNGYHEDVPWQTARRYTPQFDLPDGSYVDVRLTIADGDWNGGDVDAEATSISHRFVVDTLGTQSVRIDGTLTSELNETGAFFIEAGVDFQASSTLVRPAGSTTFSMVALRGQGDGYVMAFVDVADTGDQDGANRGYRASTSNLSFTEGSLNVDLVFRTPIVTHAPAANASTGPRPTFRWAPYASATPDSSWVIFLGEADRSYNGPPPNLYGVPATVTEFALGGSGAYRDVGLFAQCMMAAGPEAFDPQTWTCSTPVPASATSLANGDWMWGVALLPCAYESPSYVECIGQALNGEPAAMSTEVVFTVD